MADKIQDDRPIMAVDCLYYSKHLDTIRTLCNALYRIDGCCSGGMLHVVLDDDNIDDNCIRYCLTECLVHPEKEEAGLGKLICEELLKLSMPQRRMLLRIWDCDSSYCPYNHHCNSCEIFAGEDSKIIAKRT